jgi:NAD(P)-dependent dehydrogenase (short-subunit alcohol dehydrogenase family)
LSKPKPVALVTGSSRGIGLETVRQLARLGGPVLLTARDVQKAEEASAKLSFEGLSALPRALDVTSLDSIQDLADNVEREHGRLDVLINNAGVFLDKQDFAEHVSADVVRQTFETNLIGALQVCQAFLPLMRRQNYGRIVNVSSALGSLQQMSGKYPAYRMSKTALNALTRVLASELEGTNIIVNACCPGWAQTEMGGPRATRPVADAADTIVWLATLPDGGPRGGYFRDRQPLPW